MQQFNTAQIERELPGVDVSAVAEYGNRLARALGATEPWVRLRGTTVEVSDEFATFVQSAYNRPTTRGDGPTGTPGWE